MATPTSKRTTSPAFQFYPKDFLSSSRVQRMTLAEVGAYIILLSHAWLAGGLPLEVPEIAKIVKVPAGRFAKMWRGVLSECFVKRGRVLVNERLEDERQKQITFREKQAANGRKGGRQLVVDSLNPNEAKPSVWVTPNKAIKKTETANSKQRSSFLVSSEEDSGENPPLDVWFRQLVTAYPRERLTTGQRTEHAFFQQFTDDERRAPEIWADMREGLANQIAGHEWRVKGMVPTLEKWLSEGRWRQRHEVAPVSTLVSDKTARTLASAAQFAKGGG